MLSHRAWGAQGCTVHPPGGMSRFPLGAGTDSSSPAIPVRCYVNNTITKTQDRDKQKTFCSREGEEGPVTKRYFVIGSFQGGVEFFKTPCYRRREE